MRLIVIGDIHTQARKLWAMLNEAGLAEGRKPSRSLLEDELKLVLLGDLLHAKSRRGYAALIGAERYDEYDPEHLKRAEAAQEAFLSEVRDFQARLPAGKMIILMGNHDYNAVHPEQGPLRTDDVLHLEWKEGGRLPQDLRDWIAGWPHEVALEGVHLAHVGPRPEHNTFDTSFYLENRRRWLYEDQDWLEGTPHQLGVYGHTPVRGGVNIASQGRAILLDTNGHGDEYCYLELEVQDERYRLKMRGLFFDEFIQRS